MEEKREQQPINCPRCGVPMEEKKVHGLRFWECPDCRAEFWEYDERAEKEIRKEFSRRPPRKKRSGGRKSRRKRASKPAHRAPWWFWE